MASRSSLSPYVWRAFLALLLTFVVHPAWAAGVAQPAEPQLLADELDPIFAQQMADHHIPGAAFVMVKDGQVVFAKGYGTANLDQQTPVDPERTIFSVMSVSKLFTATAIMQLVEQGKIRLDADVNTYLKQIRIPATYSQPVTIAQLLTHTAGFDDDTEAIGAVAATPDAVLSLREHLAAHPPVRILPPGERMLYSNVAYDILGAVVEDVTGQPFARYMDAHVLRPLGMTHSSFLPPAKSGDLATSYRYDGTQLMPMPRHYFSNAPSAGLMTTAANMAHFLIAQLQQGQYANQAILRPETVALMQRQQYPSEPDEPGVGYGFYTATLGSYRVVWKDGDDLDRTHSKLVLYPDRHIGFFIAQNSGGDTTLLDAVVQQLDQRYNPVPPISPVGQSHPETAGALTRYTGHYRIGEYPHSTIVKLAMLQREVDIQISASPDGSLTWTTSDGAEETFVEVRPGVFRSPKSYFAIAFRSDADGNVTHIELGYRAFEKIAWYETLAIQRGLWIGFSIVFLIATLALPILAWRRRPRTRMAQIALGLAWLVALLNLIFLIGLAILQHRFMGREQMDTVLECVRAALAAHSAHYRFPEL
jgi:CubicO group peptidase (beta-lactamase class C family)